MGLTLAGRTAGQRPCARRSRQLLWNLLRLALQSNSNTWRQPLDRTSLLHRHPLRNNSDIIFSHTILRAARTPSSAGSQRYVMAHFCSRTVGITTQVDLLGHPPPSFGIYLCTIRVESCRGSRRLGRLPGVFSYHYTGVKRHSLEMEQADYERFGARETLTS